MKNRINSCKIYAKWTHAAAACLLTVMCIISPVQAEDVAAEAQSAPVHLAVGDVSVDIIKALNPKSQEWTFYNSSQLDDWKAKRTLEEQTAAAVLIDESFATDRLKQNMQHETWVQTKEYYSIPETLKELQRVGKKLGLEVETKRTAQNLQDKYKDFQFQLGTQPGEMDVVFIVDWDKGQPIAVGYNTPIDKIILIAAGYNVVQNFSGHKPLTQDMASGLQPERLVVTDTALDKAGGKDALFADPAIAALGVDENNLIVVPEKDYRIFGPNTINTVIDLAAEFYPELDLHH